MKKLTAGIFATILGVTAMGAADAAVTSKGYVDAAVGAVATSVSNTYATKQALADEKSTLQQNINAVAEVANAAAPQVTTYTKEEVDAKIAGVDGATAIAGLQNQIDAINLEQTAQDTNITNLQNDKANAADVYTKTETNNLLGAKANSADLATVATTGAYTDLTGTPDVYTKTEADAAFATATQGATADAAAAALNTASKLSDGQYALTMKVVDGVTTYGWELIDREYVASDVTPNNQ